MSFLSGLNINQKKAVTYKGNKSLMVVAGAGAGKTKTLTSRIAFLISKGVLPSRIMVTTFTKKAAEEMQERLEGIIGENKSDRLKIGTSHSLFLRVFKDLREFNGKYEHPRLIMGGGRFMTMLGIINKYKSGKKDHEHRFATKDIKGILNQISYWKNEGLRVKDVEKQLREGPLLLFNGNPEENEDWSYTLEGTYLQAYKDYEAENKQSNRIDFDDFLLKTFHQLRLKKNKKFLDRVKRKTEYIFIDEAQDLNKIQFLIFDLVSNKNNMTIVLDDYQCLYGFRGARIEYIQNFIETYKPYVVKLEQNYRSTKHIVEYGNLLIKNNETQIWKNLFTENEQGIPAKITVSTDVEDEARVILEEIQELIYSGYELNDIAILYRTNAQSRAIVDEFIVNHIPHKVYSREGFYDRREVKDMLAYLKIANDPHDANADDFKRIMNRPARFLGKKIMDDVEDLMFENEYDSFWLALKAAWNLDLGPRQKQNVDKFVNLIERMCKRCETEEMTTRETLDMIIDETGYLVWMNKKDQESGEEEPDNDNEMNLNSLLIGSERFENPQEFLLFVESQEFEKNEDEDAIHVMTVHKSKGTEFPFVFIIGLCTPVMPHYKADDLEEERRIAYVAVTRAQENLHLSTIEGKFNRMKAHPSYFIQEMGLTLEKASPSDKFFEIMAGIDSARKPSEAVMTKYDEKGNVIAIEKIDSTLYNVADKNNLIEESTGKLVESESLYDTEGTGNG